MKRLALWMFRLAAVVSLVLCIATVADRFTHAWRSTRIELSWWRMEGADRLTRKLSVTTGKGVVMATMYRYTEEDRTAMKRNRFFFGSGPHYDNWMLGDTLIGRAGFGVYAHAISRAPGATNKWGSMPRTEQFTGFGLPNWFAESMFGLIPALWWRSHLNHRVLVRTGHCINCGYDLRATPDRCPECGTIPLTAKGEAA